MKSRIFITGGTGYIGSRLIPALRARGHEVTALVRSGSETKIKADCRVIVGNALDGYSYGSQLGGACETFIHLVGVSHPNPSKAREFAAVDKRAAEEAIRVASETRVRHFIYLSVAHPAPVMKAYIEVRHSCETVLCASGLNATIVRPWYVVGPGHWWPLILKPFYAIAEHLPSSREGAMRLGLVTIKQIVYALTVFVENPATGIRIASVADIRNAARG
jgi:nucleoside-diphosphate-sugar epimerase